MRCKYYNKNSQCACEERLVKMGENVRSVEFQFQPHLACMGKLPSSCEWYDTIQMQ
jgi:hypothetical protein